MKTSGIGGQAVMEGVMMRNGKDYAVAVRKPDNTIELKKDVYISASSKNAFFKLPLVRGVVAFVDSLILGMSTLTYSSEVIEGDDEDYEPSKFEKFLISVFKEKAADVVMTMVVMISILFAVGLFVLLPTFVAGLLGGLIKSELKQTAVEGGIRLLLFILYVWLISLMKDIKRTYMYHGAEHKCINCIESGKDLTVENVRNSSRFHKRCGTSFLFIVMFISIIMFMFIRVDNFALKILFRLLLIPVISGISYEFIRLAGSKDSLLLNILSAPGMCLQRITTSEPDDDMIEVGIASVEAVFDWRSFVERVRRADANEDDRFEVTSEDIDYSEDGSREYYDNSNEYVDGNVEYADSFEANDLELEFDEFEETQDISQEELELSQEELELPQEEPELPQEELELPQEELELPLEELELPQEELELPQEDIEPNEGNTILQENEILTEDDIMLSYEVPQETLSEEDIEAGFEQVLVEEPISHVEEESIEDDSLDSVFAKDGSMVSDGARQEDNSQQLDERLLDTPLTKKSVKQKRKSKKESGLKKSKKRAKESIVDELNSGKVEILKEEEKEDDIVLDDILKDVVQDKVDTVPDEDSNQMDLSEIFFEDEKEIESKHSEKESVLLEDEKEESEKLEAADEKVETDNLEVTDEIVENKKLEAADEKEESESLEVVQNADEKTQREDDIADETYEKYDSEEYDPAKDDYEDDDGSVSEEVGGLFSKFKSRKKSKSLSYEERIARHKAISLYDEDYDESDELLRRLDELIVSKDDDED